MSKEKSKKFGVIAGGIGFVPVLFFIFLILKLIKVINWSWLWVFSPFWIPFLVVLVVRVIVYVFLKRLG